MLIFLPIVFVNNQEIVLQRAVKSCIPPLLVKVRLFLYVIKLITKQITKSPLPQSEHPQSYPHISDSGKVVGFTLIIYLYEA